MLNKLKWLSSSRYQEKIKKEQEAELNKQMRAEQMRVKKEREKKEEDDRRRKEELERKERERIEKEDKAKNEKIQLLVNNIVVRFCDDCERMAKEGGHNYTLRIDDKYIEACMVLHCQFNFWDVEISPGGYFPSRPWGEPDSFRIHICGRNQCEVGSMNCEFTKLKNSIDMRNKRNESKRNPYSDFNYDIHTYCDYKSYTRKLTSIEPALVFSYYIDKIIEMISYQLKKKGFKKSSYVVKSKNNTKIDIEVTANW